MYQDYDKRTIRRILNVLIAKILSNYKEIKEIMSEELLLDLKQLGISNIDKHAFDNIRSNIEVQNAIENDLLNTYLSFLQDFINKNEYKSLKPLLITAKYYASFINSDIEKEMVKNRFSVSSSIYVNSRLIADFTKMKLELYKMLKNLYSTELSTTQISELLEISDLDYGDKTKATGSILDQCLLRSAFLLMDDEEIADVNYEFHKFIENKTYLEKHKYNKISESIIIQSFKSIKRDKSKHYVLSLGIKL